MLARGGYNWILGTLLLSTIVLLGFLFIGNKNLLFISVVLLVFVCFFFIFFRDPERNIPKTTTSIVAPADGRIIFVTTFKRKVEKNNTSKEFIRIATFMSVINVHVNRAPIDGKILSMVHKPGRLLPAYKTESMNNERLISIIQTRLGVIKVIQIAGLIAQRIVPYVTPGQVVNKGQRIGIIQFGSRVDLLLPKEVIKVKVSPGDHVSAGCTTIAEIIKK